MTKKNQILFLNRVVNEYCLNKNKLSILIYKILKKILK